MEGARAIGEIVVVDNNSDDRTAEIAKAEESESCSSP